MTNSQSSDKTKRQTAGERLMHHPEFKDFWKKNAVLNPSVNPASVKFTSKLNYFDADRQIRSASVAGLLHRKHLLFSCNSLPACEDEEFARFFMTKLNGHVDFPRLKRTDSEQILFYTATDGSIRRTTARQFFQNRSHRKYREEIKEGIRNAPEPGKIHNATLMENPQFLAFWDANKDYNPGVDPFALRMKDTANVKNVDGTISRVQIQSILKRKDSFQKKQTQNELPKEIFPRSTLLQCSNGHPSFACTAARYEKFHGNMDLLCPYCSGHKAVPGVDDAVTLDPDLRLFWGSNKRNIVGLKVNHKIYNFVCPYCGCHFRKGIDQMVLKYPKCPQCMDSGTIATDSGVSMPENIPFAVAPRNSHARNSQ